MIPVLVLQPVARALAVALILAETELPPRTRGYLTEMTPGTPLPIHL